MSKSSTSIDNSPEYLKMGLCDGYGCSMIATDTVEVKAGKYVISLNLCKNCVSRVSDNDI